MFCDRGLFVDAFKYLTQQGYCVRIIDNLYDQDYPPTNEELLDVSKLLFSVIPSNPFYQEHIKNKHDSSDKIEKVYNSNNDFKC